MRKGIVIGLEKEEEIMLIKVDERKRKIGLRNIEGKKMRKKF